MKYYLQYEIHHSKYYLQMYFETCPTVSNITTICPRAVTSVEVQRMMKFHYLPQNCTFSGRRAKTKLFKFQQIDAKNVKKHSRRNSCAKPMNPKREIIGNMWFGGHKEISHGTP